MSCAKKTREITIAVRMTIPVSCGFHRFPACPCVTPSLSIVKHLAPKKKHRRNQEKQNKSEGGFDKPGEKTKIRDIECNNTYDLIG